MFNSNGGCNYSLADIAAATGGGSRGNSGWGGDGGAWWIIILFLFVFCGWGDNGNGLFGGRGGGGANSPALQGILTRGDLCQDMNFNNLESAVRGIQNGLCDGFYAQNTNLLTGFSNVNQTLCQGFNGINQNIVTQGYESRLATQGLSSQLASCCCDIERGLDALSCQSATNTANIIQAGNNNTQRILDYLCNEKIEALRAENVQLQNTISQQAQSNYIINQIRPFPSASYVVPNPFTGSYGYGNCGCNSGCGCGVNVM